MKTRTLLAAASFAVLLSLASLKSLADDQAHPIKPYKGSEAFERMKTLVGSWEGLMTMGDQKIPITATYKVTSGGSAIMETVFEGQPNEMVTLYHDDAKKRLKLTHYCALSNQPQMALGKANKKALSFEFDPSCGIDVKTVDHMHGMRLVFVDENTIRQNWTFFQKGAREKNVVEFKRLKSRR